MSSMLPPPPQMVSQTTSPALTEIVPSQPEPTGVVLWNQQRVALLRKTIAAQLTDIEFELFLEICKRRQLDPFARQIYGVKRGGSMVIQTSIDGYRLIAERSGKYLGQTSPFWCGEDSKWVDVWTKKVPPFAAKVGVHKQGQIEPTWGIAYWETYKAPGPFWQKAGAHMLAKCAEALALKKAFPEELSGLYTDDEMAQADVTMVSKVAAPVVGSDDPVMIFPTDVVNSWADHTGTTRAEVKDANGDVWQFSGSQLPQVDAAITNNTHLLIKFTVESNIRVVSEIIG